MRIFHLGAWNRNYGDWAIQRVVRGLLSDLGEPYEIIDLDSQRTVFDDALIAEINSNGDLLIVGGGGLIFNRPEDNSQSGWQFNISEGGLRTLATPVMGLSLGYNRFPYDPHPVPKALASHFSTFVDVAMRVSVRNQGSLDRLSEIGVEGLSKVSVVPDPVAAYPLIEPCRELLTLMGIELGQPIIGLNLAGDRLDHRFGPDWKWRSLGMVEALAETLRGIVEKSHAKVVSLPHLDKIDNMDELLEPIRRSLEDSFVEPDQLVESYFPPQSGTVNLLASLYRLSAVNVGMRGHAGILSFSQGRPFVYVGDHPKGSYFATDVGHPEWSLSTDAFLHNDRLFDTLEAILRDRSGLEATLAEKKTSVSHGVKEYLRNTIREVRT